MAIQEVPKNLKILLDQKQEGYELRVAYFLELEHPCMGTFPAITCEGEEMVIATDQAVLAEMAKTLTPRRSKVSKRLVCVNPALGMGFVIRGLDEWWWEDTEPLKFFTLSDIAALLAKNPKPFKWAPGLIGDDMNREEFVETLVRAGKSEGP
jgi:hypothetical protein